MNVIGKVFVIEKHWTRTDATNKHGKLLKVRRMFHPQSDFNKAVELADKYAAQGKDDYLVVMVMHESPKKEDDNDG